MVADVEIVVAVHDPDRPVERAVASVTACARAAAIVVVHNTDVAPIRARLGALARDPRVRVIHVQDGLHSAAGPFNAGLDVATAPFVGVLGSDDELAPGAVAGWLALQQRTDADVVIARLAIDDPRRSVRTPPVRVPRRRHVDGVRDRLSYRSAPLGIYRRSRFPDLRFTPGVATGEDVAFVTALWFSPARRVFDARGAAYILHTDSARRVTLAPRPVADDLAFLPAVWASLDALGLNARQRGAVVVKLIRVNLFGAVANRTPSDWTPSERAALARLTRDIVAAAPNAPAVLSRGEWRLLRAMEDPTQAIESVYALLRRRRRGLSGLVSHAPGASLRREAPLRFAAASVIRGAARVSSRSRH